MIALQTLARIGTLVFTSTVLGAPPELELSLKIKERGETQGVLVQLNPDAVVLRVNQEFLTVRWGDVETASAYRAKKKILVFVRGSQKNFTAEDHFQLGYFLALRNRTSAAVQEFNRAKKRDAAYGARIQEAWRQIRIAREANRVPTPEVIRPNVEPAVRASDDSQHYMREHTPLQHAAAIEEFKAFGAVIRDALVQDLVLLETRHFLIWTDWPETDRNLLPDWEEAMYRELCREFGFPEDQPIWLGKCPVFCFREKDRFVEFARIYDGYDAGDNLGYTKTLGNGYVHVVLRRLGSRPKDLNDFATTMVHESTHAFMHCYRSPRTLPPWLNEGLADFIAERVLGDRCSTGENALALAKNYAYNRKSIQPLFAFETSPPGQWYPVAHGVVDYLFHRDAKAFVDLVKDIKDGMKPVEALGRHYRGMDYKSLERDWHHAILTRYPPG